MEDEKEEDEGEKEEAEKEGDEGIRHFCQLWRAVFVDALQPAFLPPGWDVTHR